MSEIKDIQILALNNIEDPDGETYYRRICRWYSREFSTPLETVIYDIPEKDVLIHYYEDLYYGLYNDESEEGQMRYHSLREAILGSNKDTVEDELQEEQDDNWADEMNEQIRREEAEIVAKKAKIAETKEEVKKPNLINEDFNVTVKGE